MASNYIPQGTRRDIQVLSQTQVIDVQRDAGITIPSNIYFEVPIPLEAWQAGSGPEYMTTTAGGLEELNAGLNVASVYWTQDIDANGLQADYAVAIVQIQTPAGRSGTFSTQVTFPLGVISSDPEIYNALVVPQLEAATKQLEKDAAG